jgi:hypothetical protein
MRPSVVRCLSYADLTMTRTVRILFRTNGAHPKRERDEMTLTSDSSMVTSRAADGFIAIYEASSAGQGQLLAVFPADAIDGVIVDPADAK